MAALSADHPITMPDQDRLGYSHFAESLAKSICSMVPIDGITMSIYGPWGSGKSTVLNLIKHYLKSYDKPPAIVHFNPWWFSGQEDLTRRFFSQFISAIGGRRLKGLKEKFSKYSASFAEIPLIEAIPILKDAKAIAKFMSDISKSTNEDVAKLKEEISEILREKGNKYLIVIDDIDRLTAEEMRSLFRLIKAVADFPNVIYLLAFDKNIVAKSLEGVQGTSGLSYLEKIVQVAFDLPNPSKSDIMALFTEKMDAIIQGVPNADKYDHLFEKEHWSKLFLEGLFKLIKTPRDVIRIANLISVTYPEVAGEVNIADFISIESIHILCPSVYEFIRDNPDELTYSRMHSDSIESRQADAMKVFHDNWQKRISDSQRDPIIKMVNQLFPRSIINNRGQLVYSSYARGWRQKLRACLTDRHSMYFRLSLDSGTVSNTLLRSIIELASLPGASQLVDDKIRSLIDSYGGDGYSMVHKFLFEIQDYTSSEIPENAINSLVLGVLRHADAISATRRPITFFDIPTDLLAEQVVYQLLIRLPAEQRIAIVHEILKSDQTLGMMCSMFNREARLLAKPPEDPNDFRPLFTRMEFDALKPMLISKIHRAAASGAIWNVPGLGLVLYVWKIIEGVQAPRDWLGEIISTEAGLFDLLEQLTYKVRSWTIGSNNVGEEKNLEIRFLAEFMNISEVQQRIQDSLTQDSTSPKRQELAALFMKSVAKNCSGPQTRDE